MTDMRTSTGLRRKPLQALLRSSPEPDDVAPNFYLNKPIDRTRWFVCPTLTPLYYTRIYQDMTRDQQRRYNQLTALSFNELIDFFETVFASSVLATLVAVRRHDIDPQLVECLAAFVAEERQHTQWWRQLNRLSEPELYDNSEHYVITGISMWAQRFLGLLTAHPQLFPVVFWIMLALEERSLDISRRTIRMDHDKIEPHYLALYRRHLKDEVRHVQIDWHLIDRFFANRTPILRRLNAKLFCLMMKRFFIPPTRSAVRVVHRLVTEDQQLAPLAAEMERQLTQLGSDLSYHEMMYSRRGTPITFALFDRFPELHAMRHVIRSYHPG